MLRRDAGVGAASECPLLHPAPHTPSKPVQGAPDRTPEIIQPEGVENIHLTRVHLLHAQPACRTRLCTHVPRGQLGWVCTGRAAQAGRAPRLQLCHACVPPHARTTVLAPCFRGRDETWSMGTGEIMHHFLPPVCLCTVRAHKHARLRVHTRLHTTGTAEMSPSIDTQAHTETRNTQTFSTNGNLDPTSSVFSLSVGDLD